MAENIKKIITENDYIPTPEDFKIVGADTTQSEEIYKPSLTFWQDGWRRFKKNKLALSFLGITLIFLFLAIFGQSLTKYSYRAQDLSAKFLSPAKGLAKGHYLGTDNLGRDLFARLSQGIRISMELSLITAAICVVFGTIYGAVSAYFGGIIDTIMTRIVEILLIIPSMIYIILLMVVMGNSVKTIIIAMSLTRWLNYSLLVRGEVLKIKENEFVLASKSLGGNFLWITLKHLIPNTLSVIIIRLTTDIPNIIFTEAFLSFIGLGVPIPQASLGNLVFDGFVNMTSYPYLFIIPSVVISLITLAFNIVGDALNDALNPKLRD
ncbi:ABC-type oligopeptide transport system, permease component [Leptotrichia trevisanii]|uniref:ABC-type oligopeptide transport system, permease component n=1 Tax=Leptotrichia trevisanii TaxID=109328 RepID=A0A510KWN9_9FUSO|nr:ABC transporter permease [Leptotrichia trevisanii]BBM43962.1 ABC-type oligopeptide transport system, permease component [Leptotrichia trevisanii]BBM51102.1 ABC-type oligopeptide transport system, permease component [Leptotrichia trevisanii]BBM56102.1 ABC-type oligopeptide transport system, permease component [Leptotrichia trevisanii]